MTETNLAQKYFRAFDPYVVCEIGVNHEGSMRRAKEMIDQVAEAGAHAAKFQTYKAALLAAPVDSPAYWNLDEEPTTSQFELFSKHDSFEPEQYQELAVYCEAVGIDFLSTPFDLQAAEFLSGLCRFTKIASVDITNVPLLRKVASFKKPVMLSVGAATDVEIQTALSTLRRDIALPVVLLHCVINYPTSEGDAHLSNIVRLRKVFGNDNTEIGYSCHVAKPVGEGIDAALVSFLMGAAVIEKHFTDDRSLPGNDHYHAWDFDGLSAFVRQASALKDALGEFHEPDLKNQAKAILNARRRIYVARALAANHLIAEDDLLALRSTKGIEVANWDKVIGRKTARVIDAMTALNWEELR
jgi:sialic acid synthase SpsE